MAITTLQGAKDGLLPDTLMLVKASFSPESTGVFHSLFYVAGKPLAGSAPIPGLNGEALTSVIGAFKWRNPSSGNSYLTGGNFSTAGLTTGIPSGTLILCDRLWQNSGISITTTTEQAITSVEWPTRDRNGSTNGEDVLVGIEVSTVTGNAAAITNTTLNYTNSVGTIGRTGTMTNVPATAIAGTFVPFELAAGDSGIRSIQGVTLGTSYVSGTIHLVAYRIVVMLTMPGGNVPSRVEDTISCGFPQLYDNSCLFAIWLPGDQVNTRVAGFFRIAQG